MNDNLFTWLQHTFLKFLIRIIRDMKDFNYFLSIDPDLRKNMIRFLDASMRNEVYNEIKDKATKALFDNSDIVKLKMKDPFDFIHYSQNQLSSLKGKNSGELEGFKLTFLDYSSLVVPYAEIFLHRDYDIDLKTDKPYIIDCGSHIGISVLFYKKKFPNAEIVCFEADPQNYQVLVENIKNNDLKDIQVHNLAVTNQEGSQIEFNRTLGQSMGGGTSIRMKASGHDIETILVKTTALSKYLDRRVDFLKIDIEGVEDLVITEASAHLKNVRYLFCEFHKGVDLPHGRLERILAILTENGFEFNVTLSHSCSVNSKFKPFKEVMKGSTHLIYAVNTRIDAS